ncbi:MAG: serine hydrolase, partial [Candidatus Cloacimonetes bacterium]|nr:serine hydrolase [Candidatus Cloacimonadota bacterium]
METMNKIKYIMRKIGRKPMLRQIAIIALVLFSFIIMTISCNHKSTNPLTLKARFQSELETLHDQYKFPGATAAYILPDGTVEVVATGLADVESKISMTAQSRMLAASIGKTFV